MTTKWPELRPWAELGGWDSGTSVGHPLSHLGHQGDNKLFEMLSLEGAQAGLSWDTILRKREAPRW